MNITLEELAKKKESSLKRTSELKINLSNKKLMKISSLDRSDDTKIDEISAM